ncbi:hypothetical protein CVIRNUC_003169 [Coccomyxa viridis]|uniref:Alfin N-terminal domain-containing protein n=1 Tax=Coccomyxa viridis TaxID=1274662 RepID=A0AAV1HYV9_9CHLO|nr:hypothetical protein CVIRNUC_003169 [Coccomyxa viridis]
MSAQNSPRTVEDIYEDFELRRNGLLTALTTDVDDFYRQCDPDRENLCLYGETNGAWTVDLPAEEVPPELPEPCLGINFARDGMARKDWLALVAVHSDSWLYAVSFYHATKLDATSRLRLFKSINQYPTLYEVVTGKHKTNGRDFKPGRRRPEPEMPVSSAKAADSPLPTGRLLTYSDIVPQLKGRQAELFWPDDKMWYLVEIHSIIPSKRTAKIQYTSGEIEELDLDEIIREGHMSLITQ